MNNRVFILENVVSINPEVLSGTPVFTGTRMPIQLFVDHVHQHILLEEFYEGFPTVTREQTDSLLKLITLI